MSQPFDHESPQIETPRPGRTTSGKGLIVGFSVLVVVALAITTPIWKARVSTRALEQCRRNLKIIGLALQQYHEHHGSYPPAYVVDTERRRLHSWRVLILPELGFEKLYTKYRLDEPWDGLHNRQLVAEMPQVFACPAGESRTLGVTSYAAVVGPTTIWPDQYSAKQRNVTDASNNTLQVVESHDLHVTWTEPRDLSFEDVKLGVSSKQSPGVSSPHEGGAHTLFANGDVRFVNKYINKDVLTALCTIASGLPLPGVDWKLPVEFSREQLTEPRPAESLSHTSVQACLDTPLAPGHNVIYCSTFQQAWDVLRDELGVNEVQLAGLPQLAAQLNSQRFPPDSLSASDFLAMAGRIDQGILGKIDTARKAKFPDATFPLPQPTPLAELLAYCYLQKRLPFEAKFDRLLEPLRFHGSDGERLVANFGIKDFQSTDAGVERLRTQIDVLDFVDDDDFVIRLKTLKDHILVAKMPPLVTLDATWQRVLKRIKNPMGGVTPPPLLPVEPFAMPCLALFVERSYDELERRAVVKPEIDLRLAIAKQLIKFQLDESGAKLESAAELFFDSGDSGPPCPPRPRRFVLDRPFLLALHERGTETPYLVLWIDNDELMIASESKARDKSETPTQ